MAQTKKDNSLLLNVLCKISSGLVFAAAANTISYLPDRVNLPGTIIIFCSSILFILALMLYDMSEKL